MSRYDYGSRIKKHDRAYLLHVGKCMYCGSSEFLEIDHIHPKFKNGKSDLNNLTVACASCNCRKGILTIDEFLVKIIRDREIVYNKVIGHITNVKINRLVGDCLSNPWLENKIIELKKSHSYFTRIINSITHRKYLVT